jgi:hypothetical protein
MTEDRVRMESGLVDTAQRAAPDRYAEGVVCGGCGIRTLDRCNPIAVFKLDLRTPLSCMAR